MIGLGRVPAFTELERGAPGFGEKTPYTPVFIDDRRFLYRSTWCCTIGFYCNKDAVIVCVTVFSGSWNIVIDSSFVFVNRIDASLLLFNWENLSKFELDILLGLTTRGLIMLKGPDGSTSFKSLLCLRARWLLFVSLIFWKRLI